MQHWSIVIPALITPLVGLAGYLFGKRKTTAEAAGLELANVEHAIKIWRSIAEDLSTQVVRLTSEINDLRRENVQLKTDFQALHKKINEVTVQQN